MKMELHLALALRARRSTTTNPEDPRNQDQSLPGLTRDCSPSLPNHKNINRTLNSSQAVGAGWLSQWPPELDQNPATIPPNGCLRANWGHLLNQASNFTMNSLSSRPPHVRSSPHCGPQPAARQSNLHGFGFPVGPALASGPSPACFHGGPHTHCKGTRRWPPRFPAGGRPIQDPMIKPVFPKSRYPTSRRQLVAQTTSPTLCILFFQNKIILSLLFQTTLWPQILS